MTAAILRGDARNIPLADASVDLIVTSPPYFGLRSYTDGGEHYDGQIGAEPSPREYVAALLECTREWMRVLKPEGSLWINLGDKYSGTQAQNDKRDHARVDSAAYWRQTNPKNTGIPAKSLMGFPWRYALGCIDQTLPYQREQFLEGLLADIARGDITPEMAQASLREYDASPKSKGLGLILRAEVIWSKPNGLPESVTDRVRRSHEQWFHFVQQPRYFSAVDEIREAHTDTSAHAMSRRSRTDSRLTAASAGQTSAANPLGKLPGSVWEVATQPLKVPAELAVDHFAAFPMEWPRRIISGWSPAGICTVCGEGRRSITSGPQVVEDRGGRWQGATSAGETREANASSSLGRVQTRTIVGYACACPDTTAPTRPAVVLDPFGGTGTAALVADTLGRHGISIDRSADYCRLAAWRTTDRAERARALGVAKPPPVMDGQGDLFGEGAA